MFKNKFVEVVCDTGQRGNREGRIMLVHRLEDNTFYTTSKKNLRKKIKKNPKTYGEQPKGYFTRHSKHGKRYVAQVYATVDGKKIWKVLGTFGTPEEAHAKYLLYKKEHNHEQH